MTTNDTTDPLGGLPAVAPDGTPRKLGGLFSGIGGFEHAWTRAGGEVAWMCEIDARAREVLAERFPGVPIYEDVNDLDPAQVEAVDVLTGGSPCFPAGALVTTVDGPKPIEDIVVGDVVLSHTGKWRRVTAAGSKVSDTVIVKGAGSPGIETTPNHRFLAAEKQRVWDNDRRTHLRRIVDEPDWVRADEMEGKFWAVPVDIDWLDTGAMPFDPTPEFMRMLGRWVGDGWVRDGQRPNRPEGQRWWQTFIACNRNEVDDLSALLDVLPWHYAIQDEDKASVKFRICDKTLTRFLTESFGRYAHDKHLPSWLFTMPEEARQAFLRGYLNADGSDLATTGGWYGQATTVSKKLVVGLRILCEGLGMGVGVTSYRTDEGKFEETIEGRTVTSRGHYVVRVTPQRSQSSRVEMFGKAWGLVRSVTPGRQQVRVYDLTVEVDHSYTVDGTVVHNCQSFSAAGMRKGMHGESGLVIEMLRIIDGLEKRGLQTVVWENVTGVLTIKNPGGGHVWPQLVASFLFGLDDESVRAAREADTPDPKLLRVPDGQGGYEQVDFAGIDPSDPPPLYVISEDTDEDVDGAVRSNPTVPPTAPADDDVRWAAAVSLASRVADDAGYDDAGLAARVLYASDLLPSPDPDDTAAADTVDDAVEELFDAAASPLADGDVGDPLDVLLPAAADVLDEDRPDPDASVVLRPISYEQASPRILLDASDEEVAAVADLFSPKVKWYAGMAATDSRAMAWRVLDSRYVGAQVPQRRKRVFAVTHLNGTHREERALSTVLSLDDVTVDGTDVEVGERDAAGAWTPPWTEQLDLFSGMFDDEDSDVDGGRAKVWLLMDDKQCPEADRWTDLSQGRCVDGDVECSHTALSHILEPVVADKYMLSPRARLGIVLRATRRGKDLPDELETALTYDMPYALGAELWQAVQSLRGKCPPDLKEQLNERLDAYADEAAVAKETARAHDGRHRSAKVQMPPDHSVTLGSPSSGGQRQDLDSMTYVPMADVTARDTDQPPVRLHRLSPRACAGVLLRAASADRDLPDELADALRREVVGHVSEPVLDEVLAAAAGDGLSDELRERLDEALPGSDETTDDAADLSFFRALSHGEYVDEGTDGASRTINARDGNVGTVDVVVERPPTGVFRKSRRPQTPDDDETWIEAEESNTLNTFDEGDIRTTHAIIVGNSADVRGRSLAFNQRDEARISDEAYSLQAQPGVDEQLVLTEDGPAAVRRRDDGAAVEMGDEGAPNTIHGAGGGSSRDYVLVTPADAESRQVFRKVSHGEYEDSDDASTVTARDHKGDSDLVAVTYRKVAHGWWEQDTGSANTVLARDKNDGRDLVVTADDSADADGGFTFGDGPVWAAPMCFDCGLPVIRGAVPTRVDEDGRLVADGEPVDLSEMLSGEQCGCTDEDGRPATLMRIRHGKPGGGKGPLLSDEKSLTLWTANDQILFVPKHAATLTSGSDGRAGRRQEDDTNLVAAELADDGNPRGSNVHGEHSSAMRSPSDGAVAFGTDVSRALDTTGGFATNQGGTVAHGRVGNVDDEDQWVLPVRHATTHGGSARGGDGISNPDDPAYTLTGRPDPGVAAPSGATYGVRRLTPLEAERLQGFPPVLRFRMDRMGRREWAWAVLMAGVADVVDGRVVRVTSDLGTPLPHPAPVDGTLLVEVGTSTVKVPTDDIVAAASGNAGTLPTFSDDGQTHGSLADHTVWTVPAPADRWRESPKAWLRERLDTVAAVPTVTVKSDEDDGTRSVLWAEGRGWTQPGDDEDDMADTQRYRQLGNAVSTSVVAYLLRRASAATGAFAGI